MPITPLDSRRLYRQIADQLIRLIDSGEYRVGQRMPAERDLSEQLGVSRATVREALIALEIEGFVDVRGGSGVFVISRKASRVLAPGRGPEPGPFDLLRARWFIEAEAAAMAAELAAPEHLQRLKHALQRMLAFPTHCRESIAADRDFHLTIAEASGNSALLMVIAQLWEQRTGSLYTQLESHFYGESIWRQAMDEHSELLRAIAGRDPSAARAAMRAHLKNAEIRFASNWKPDPPADLQAH